MSETILRFRKTPKTPFIAGNVLLAALGAGLVFFGPDPFSVSTVLLVALCLFAGGILTLIPFLLDQFALFTVQQSRFSQSAVNLRSVMERSEEILDRLDQTDAENNPLRLVSERLPELVEEKIKEALARAGSQADESREAILSTVRDLQGLPDDLEKLHDDVRILSSHGATREYLGTGLENLEAKIHRLEVLLNETRRMDRRENGEEPTTPAEKRTDTRDSPRAEAPEPSGASAPESKTSEPSTSPSASVEPQKKEEIPKPETEKIDGRAEPKPVEKRKRKAEIVVAAFVGIQNGIFLRGNGPGLDPDKGLRMEMTGIGEWAWNGEVKEKFTAELFLNDKNPSNLGSFTVSPGDVLKLNPTFPPGHDEQSR